MGTTLVRIESAEQGELTVSLDEITGIQALKWSAASVAIEVTTRADFAYVMTIGVL